MQRVQVKGTGNNFAMGGICWTKVTCGIWFWPQFKEHQKSVLDEDDHLAILTEWENQNYMGKDAGGHSPAH